MKGIVALVAGGAGHAGSCIAQTLLDRGATVIAPSRSLSRLSALGARLDARGPGELHLVRADLADTAEAESLRDLVLERHGRLDSVIASLGTFEREARIDEMDRATWDRLVFDNLTPHFVVARTFAPVLADSGGVYVTLAGITANEPMTFAAPMSVTGAGLRMLLRVLAAEYAGTAIRCHEVTLLAPILDHWFGFAPQPGWLTADEVGRFVADVLDPGWAHPDRLLLSLPEPDSPRVWRRPTPPRPVEHRTSAARGR